MNGDIRIFAPATKSVFRLLDTNGNGTGTTNAIGNYASAATDFYIEAPATDHVEIARMIVEIEDGNGMRAERYGSLGAALTNGIDVIHAVGGAESSLVDSDLIKTNAQWGAHCFDVSLKTWGAGNELLLVRWTFEKAGQKIILPGNQSGKLIVRLNDDFAGLVHHSFKVQGIQTTNAY